MAKAKKTKKSKKTVKKGFTKSSNKRLYVLLTLLTISVFVLAAMSMAKAGI